MCRFSQMRRLRHRGNSGRSGKKTGAGGRRKSRIRCFRGWSFRRGRYRTAGFLFFARRRLCRFASKSGNAAGTFPAWSTGKYNRSTGTGNRLSPGGHYNGRQSNLSGRFLLRILKRCDKRKNHQYFLSRRWQQCRCFLWHAPLCKRFVLRF